MYIKYSIIIPHKNNPLLLQRCLDSIPKREDIQIIVVDDNSCPKKVNFKEFPGLDNPYVEIFFTKEGKGAGYARNVGLDKSKGKWLFFADADDYFNECFLDSVEVYDESDADIIYFSINSVNSDTLAHADRGKYYSQLVENYCKGAKNSEDLIRYSFVPPWAKMIRHELFRKYNVYFDEVIASNDIMFSIKTGHFAKKILANQNQIYCVTLRNGSLTRSKNFEIMHSRYSAILRTNDFLKSVNKKKYRRSIMYYIVHSLKYGFPSFCKTIFLGYKYRANLFIGIRNWPKTIFTIIRQCLAPR